MTVATGSEALEQHNAILSTDLSVNGEVLRDLARVLRESAGKGAVE